MGSKRWGELSSASGVRLRMLVSSGRYLCYQWIGRRHRWRREVSWAHGREGARVSRLRSALRILAAQMFDNAAHRPTSAPSARRPGARIPRRSHWSGWPAGARPSRGVRRGQDRRRRRAENRCRVTRIRLLAGRSNSPPAQRCAAPAAAAKRRPKDGPGALDCPTNSGLHRPDKPHLHRAKSRRADAPTPAHSVRVEERLGANQGATLSK